MTLVITIGWTIAGRGEAKRLRGNYAGATAPVRLGARRHHSAHGAQIIHVMESNNPGGIRPIGE